MKYMLFKDAVVAKGKNKRVLVSTLGKYFLIRFVRTTKPEHRAELEDGGCVRYFRDKKIKVTEIILEPESLDMLLGVLGVFYENGLQKIDKLK